MLNSGQTFFSRPFALKGENPNEMVLIGFASQSENLFQDEALVSAIARASR
jgi:hypothetical protein